eukprot:CAMPEP_0117450238 /NCGR_PEP_ID=MMETSP0759-20121206/8362_1 /TAXON_ID=63605 /ORGANISM="Percolomonas cosmopolitus, Strain WS" /LENGTH=333 /DNA_ID=CAMNT_0005242747 /DNA_START=183 /DNA_END=1184 /DNA_ORIENTATION=+
MPHTTLDPNTKKRELYPPIEPYNTGMLKVDDIHELYYEESGNKNGKPVVVLHGGPGGGSEPYYRQFFDPEFYRIVCFDQRGAGRSTPHACLIRNTTWHLVDDIEKIRDHLKIDQWHCVFGGSWGACLSVAYSETHPDRVNSIVLRGVFTLRRSELEFFYQGPGTNFYFPDAWEKFVAPIPETQRADMMGAYYRYLTGDDEKKKIECAKAWSVWEMSTSRLFVDAKYIARAAEDNEEAHKFALAFARIECHYFVNAGFWEVDDQLIRNADRLKNIPTEIVCGRYDSVCPLKTSWDLHKAMPHSNLTICPSSGHSAKEGEIVHSLVTATDKLKNL